MQIIVTKAKSELSVTHTNIRILVYYKYILYIAYMLYSIVVYYNSVCIQIAAEPIR